MMGLFNKPSPGNGREAVKTRVAAESGEEEQDNG